ncbi:MAG: hypothetical protein U9O98_10455 [Asgard group archaeon]|nr:hypothetical protein [Asgard group archaeon]
MSPNSNSTYDGTIISEKLKIPTSRKKKSPKKKDNICALWVFQNCGGDKEKKLRRIVSLVRKRNSIDWLPVTTNGNICIVTYIGLFKNLIKLRSNVFGLGMESFSFTPGDYWVVEPKDLDQFKSFFEIVQADLQSQEKRLLQKRELEIKTKSISVKQKDYDDEETIELTENDIEDLRSELNAISSI